MDIDLLQLDLIKQSKKYQNLSKKLKVDITKDANKYITTFGKVPGYVILKSFKEKKFLFIEKIITFLKNFFSISRTSGYRLYNFQNIGTFKTLLFLGPQLMILKIMARIEIDTSEQIQKVIKIYFGF